ncbi:MAG: N-acetylmuramoyl-L-alanine amidase [Ruminococcaceae bacterium]|nr:N-acetylmuramoyl-L-alanine amidase [Oscillospiraceae bacterium]
MKSILYGAKFFVCAILVLSIILGISYAFSERKSDTPTSVSVSAPVIVIDAGHGGEDAGAIAQDGSLEKDLNLKIAKCIQALCEINGNSAIMTREDDRLLYDYYGELDDYTGKKKIYDLKNRVKIANEQHDAIFVSIHMNKFSSSKYSGTQIYFSPNNPSSEMLARTLQNSTRTYLQPSNNRQIKRADSSIYVLNSLDCPAVLIECGFLSNEDELGRLKDEKYQASLALVIFSGILSMS